MTNDNSGINTERKQNNLSIRLRDFALYSFSLLIILLSVSSAFAADTTPPVIGIYLGQDLEYEHNVVSYTLTVHAYLWNNEYQTSVSQCQIDWGEGAGWEAVSKGTEEAWYAVSHSYPENGQGWKTIKYRCKNSDNLWSTGNVQHTNYDTIELQDVTAPVAAWYLGYQFSGGYLVQSPTSPQLNVYAGLWNKDSQTSVDSCTINWGDGSGWQSVQDGNEDEWYFVSHTYPAYGTYTVNYRCTNHVGLQSSGISLRILRLM